MKIIELPIKVEFNDQKDYIYPSLIESRGELTLVDTGYPFCLKLIEEAIIKNHYQIGQLKKILLLPIMTWIISVHCENLRINFLG